MRRSNGKKSVLLSVFGRVEQIRPAFFCEAFGLFAAPFFDIGVVAGEQDLGDFPANPDGGTGILGILQQSPLEALVLIALGQGQHAVAEPSHRVRHQAGRELTAGQDEIPHGDLLVHDLLDEPLVHALVMAADKHQLIVSGELLGLFLIEHRTPGGEVDGLSLHGGGILEWGSHTVDLCQWAAQKDHTAPVRYEPQFNDDGTIAGHVWAYYDDGVKLVMRESGWLGLGTCSARYVGEEGWIETGDSGRMAVSNDKLRGELKYFGMPGTDPTTHIAEFVECVKTRRNPAANAAVAAQSHIASHCAYIAWQLKRTIEFDPVKEEFNDPEANRMRTRAMRAPYTL